MPGNIGRAVGIHSDDVILMRAMFQSPASIFGVGVQVIQFSHAEILLADFDNLGVNFIAVDGNITVNCRRLPSRRTRRQTDDGDALHVAGADGWRVEKRPDQKLLPGTVVVEVVGVVNRVDALPIVQAQMRFVAPLEHFDIVVRRLGLVHLPLGFFDIAPNAEKRQHGDGDDHQQVRQHRFYASAFGDANQRHKKQQKAEKEKGFGRADGRDEYQYGQISADKRAERGDGVDIARNFARLLGIIHA